MGNYVIPAHVIVYWRAEGRSEAEIEELDRHYKRDYHRRTIRNNCVYPTPAMDRLPAPTRVAELNKTMTLVEIGQRYGVHSSTVSDYLKKYGCEPVNHRGQRGKTPARDKMPEVTAIAEMNQIMTLKQIAKRFGVSYSAVRRYLTGNGIKPVDHRRRRDG